MCNSYYLGYLALVIIFFAVNYRDSSAVKYEKKIRIQVQQNVTFNHF